jgi:hypothetical protein
MISAEPQTAEFCGEVLKFATAPFRAGRSLDGAIDGLVEQMKQKGEQPRGDDPATAQNKTALQIEQLKDKREREKIQADATLQQAELKQRDEHAKLKIASDEQIAREKMMADRADDQAKAQQTNQKAMFDREKHQRDLVKKDADLRFNQQKMGLQVQQQNLKARDMAQRQAERQSMQQFKMANTPPPGASL